MFTRRLGGGRNLLKLHPLGLEPEQIHASNVAVNYRWPNDRRKSQNDVTMYTQKDVDGGHGEALTKHTLDTTNEHRVLTVNASHVVRKKLLKDPMTYCTLTRSKRFDIPVYFRHAIDEITNSCVWHMETACQVAKYENTTGVRTPEAQLDLRC